MNLRIAGDCSRHAVGTCAQVGFSRRRPDALAARSACIALRHLAAAERRPSEERLLPAYAALVAAAAGPGPAAGAADDGSWYTVAEAAITAIYALHTQPGALCEAVLRRLAREALAPAADGPGADGGSSGGGEGVSALALSRFFFVLGQVHPSTANPTQRLAGRGRLCLLASNPASIVLEALAIA